MDIKEYKKSSQLQKWAEIVRACRNSGKTVSAWCSENGINKKTYYYWQKKVCDATPGMQKTAALPRLNIESTESFAEITPLIQAGACNAGVTVRIGNAEVQIPNGAATATVETVLRVLSGIC
jgi:transposase-like protein